MDYQKSVELAIKICQDVGSGEISLFSADTDKVKSYVYSTTKLPEMRGASIILDNLNQKDVEIVFKAELDVNCILFNKGGSVLALVPTSKVKKITEQIELIYPKKTFGSATITTISVQIDSTDIKDGLITNFKKYYKSASRKLKDAKEEKKQLSVNEVIPFARRCGSCGISTANIKRTKPDEIYLCCSCDYKRRSGEFSGRSSGKTRFFRDFFNFLEEKKETEFAKRLVEEFKKLNPCLDSVDKISQKVENSRYLSEIGDSDGYIGVIYADGNEIGSKLEEIDSASKFMKFSDKLYEITNMSVYTALLNYIDPKRFEDEDRYILPFEIISIGGDDVFMIVPADIALQTAHLLCESFEGSANNSGVEELEGATLSAGVVICKDKFPVYYIYDLVNQLLKNAKKKAKSGDAKIETAIDFMVFKSQGGEVSQISEYRNQILRKIEQKGSFDTVLEMTFRPYLLKEFKDLLEYVFKLNDKGFPKSRLYAIRQALETNKDNAVLQYLYIMTRSKGSDKTLLKVDFSKFLNDDCPPWRKSGSNGSYAEYDTPIVDILEIFDFAKKFNG